MAAATFAHRSYPELPTGYQGGGLSYDLGSIRIPLLFPRTMLSSPWVQIENDGKDHNFFYKEFAESHNMIFYETSAKTSDNVQEAFNSLINLLIN